MSAPETDCPLHHADCNPVDPRHDAEHRTERGYVKMAHYATIYGGPPAGRTTPAQQAVYDYLDRIPPPPTFRPRLRSCTERWPDCDEGDYDPRCCRFPKSCSCTVYPDDTPPELLKY